MKSVLGPVETLGFSRFFVLISAGITVPSPLAMCLASKGSALGLLAVCLYQFKNKHLSELQCWFKILRKLTIFFVPQMQRSGGMSQGH